MYAATLSLYIYRKFCMMFFSVRNIPGHGNLVWLALSYQFVIQLKSHLKQADYFFAFHIFNGLSYRLID